jgi:RimJ/RimL family protein N-acetyltransferase
LYDLLAERTPQESISHKEMPTMAEHAKFVRSNPYTFWALVQVGTEYVGSVYISKQRELGISIFQKHRGHGYATRALQMAMEKLPGKFLANISPFNQKSVELFEKLGFKLIQQTYAK